MEATLRKHVKNNLSELCVRASAGSPFCALLVCIETKPDDLGSLLRTVGVAPHGKYRGRGFDACADGWAVYCDALDQQIVPR